MKILKTLAILVLLSPAALLAQTGAVQCVSTLGGTQAITSGSRSSNYLDGIIPHATVTVYFTGTSTQVPGSQVFADTHGTVLGNPFTSNNANSVNPGGCIFWASTTQAYDVFGTGGIPPNTYAQPTPLCIDCYPSSQFSVTPITLTTTGSSGPSTLTGTVLNIPVYSSGSGLCPGGTTFSLQYNAGGGVCGGDTAVTDGAGNIYSPNGSFTTTASYQGSYMFGEGSGPITVPAHAPTNFVSWAGPTSGTIALWLDFFGTAPTVPWAFTFATPATVNSRSHSQAAATPLTSFPLFGVPPCTGFTPTNGQAIEYTTASSPNPCYTAATPGGFTAGGDLSGSSTSQEVIGLNTVPFCSGFTPTNGEAVTYSTGLSPNPCYTAATPSGGSAPSVTFSIATGAAATPAAPYVRAPASGTVSDCYFTTQTSDGSTNLVFNVKFNGTNILSGTNATVTAGDSPGTSHTFALTSGTISIAQGQKWELDISTGATDWLGAVQCY